MSNITPEELLERMKDVDLSLYKKKKLIVKQTEQPKQIEEQPKEFPIVEAECTRCGRYFIGRAISFTINKKQYFPYCPYCPDIPLWFLHHGMINVIEVNKNV